MDIFKKNYRNEYKNPYRHGVCIGNYVEDIFGEDLKKKQEIQASSKENYSTEKMDKYKWPEYKEIHIKDSGNDFTKNHNTNFDFNIDLTAKNIEDYLKLQDTNLFQLQDKNSFVPDQHKSETQMKKMQESISGEFSPNDIFKETQTKLKSFHQKDTRGLLYTKKSGLVKNLYFGHGLDQKNFTKNEYASTYQ
jgi:hypothetical protein